MDKRRKCEVFDGWANEEWRPGWPIFRAAQRTDTNCSEMDPIGYLVHLCDDPDDIARQGDTMALIWAHPKAHEVMGWEDIREFSLVRMTPKSTDVWWHYHR